MINGNLPLSDADVADYETLMRSVAGNVGSASHVDSNARGQSSGKWQEAFFIFAPWLEKWRGKLMRRGILSRSEA